MTQVLAELEATRARNALLLSIIAAFVAETDEETFGRVRHRIELLDTGEAKPGEHSTG